MSPRRRHNDVNLASNFIRTCTVQFSNAINTHHYAWHFNANFNEFHIFFVVERSTGLLATVHNSKKLNNIRLIVFFFIYIRCSFSFLSNIHVHVFRMLYVTLYTKHTLYSKYRDLKFSSFIYGTNFFSLRCLPLAVFRMVMS